MNRIKELRDSAGIRQVDLARALCMSRSAIAMYETGQRALSTDIVVRLCQFYNVSADYLLGLSDDRGSAATPTGGADGRLVMDISALSPENRQRLEDYLRLLLSSQEK